MILKKDIAKEVVDEVAKSCPGIDTTTVEFCVDSAIESIKNVAKDDTDDTVVIKMYGFGSMYMDYYITLSKLKDTKLKDSPYYKGSFHKHSFLKNFKKGRKEKSREKAYYEPILKYFYERFSKKRIKYIHGNFYDYWKQLALNHNENHELQS